MSSQATSIPTDIPSLWLGALLLGTLASMETRGWQPFPARRMARALGVPPGVVERITGQLESVGLLERPACGALVRVTERGREVVARNAGPLRFIAAVGGSSADRCHSAGRRGTRARSS